MKIKYTIGEVAKLSHVSTHTLRYYDKIGLLSPSEIGEENSYRYYTHEDFLFLDTIKYLKKLGMPLEEIKEHFAKRTVDETRALYERQLVETEAQIKELESIKAHIGKCIFFIDQGKAAKADSDPQTTLFDDRVAIIVAENEPRGSIGSPFDANTKYNMIFCDVAERLYREDLKTMGNELAVKSIKDIKQGIYDKAVAVGNMLTDESDGPVVMIPRGEYGCIYHVGSMGNVSDAYKKLLKYIDSQGYDIAGDSYELYIVDSVDTAKESEYVTHIQIPIEKKK